MNHAPPPTVPRNPLAVSIEFPDGRRLGPGPHSRLKVTATLVALMMVVVLFVYASPKPVEVAHGPLGIGERAPDFVLPTDRNDTASLSQFTGRIVVIHFVIPVCCSSSALEIGYMRQVEPTIGGEIVFLSIAMNSTLGTRGGLNPLQRFRELMGFNWTLAFDSDGTVQGLYDARETSTFVIDRQGVIRHRDDETTASDTLLAWLAHVR